MKAFIIRLKENEHSCKMAQDAYNQAQLYGHIPLYFDAINGKEADKHYELTKVPRPNKKLKKGKIGVLGCFFSHYYLWHKCIKLDEPIIILEHDGYFIRKLPNNILDMFDDVLKLDNNDPYESRYNSLIAEESNLPLTVEKYINRSPKNIEKIGTGNYFKGAYSYIIKPSGAVKLVNFISLNSHRPADQQIGDAILDTRVTIPTVARLHPFYSIKDNIKTASLTGNPELL